MTTLKISVSPTAFEPAYIAQQRGYFAKEHLKVDLVAGSTAASQVTEILNGQFQLAESSGTAAASAASKGIPVTIVSGQENIVGHPVAGIFAKSTAPIMVPGNSSVMSVGDLRGQTVGLAGLGSITQLGLDIALTSANVPVSSVQVVNIPPTSFGTLASNGTVNAIVPFPPFTNLLEAQGFRVISTPIDEYLGTTPAVVFVASKAYAAQHQTVLNEFVAAMAKADAYANAHVSAVRAVDSKETTLPASYIATETFSPFSTEVIKSGLKTLLDYMHKYELAPKIPTTASFVSPSTPLTN